MFSSEQINKFKAKAETMIKPANEAVRFTNSHGQACLGFESGEVKVLNGSCGLPPNCLIYNEDGTIYCRT